jgi:CxxC-x17-CxxC domain-containing protein
MEKQLQNVPDIVSLVAKLQEQLNSLENKIDTLVARFLPKPAEVKPALQQQFQPPVNARAQNASRPENRFHSHPGVAKNIQHRERIMYKVICADCKKECAVPFRPSGDRPVYCKECFSRRKSGSAFKANIDSRPQEPAPVQVSDIGKLQAGEKKRTVAKKKPMEKKKPVSKKRKKGK